MDRSDRKGGKSRKGEKSKLLSHPLLSAITGLARGIVNIGFLVVTPTDGGWGQVGIAGPIGMPRFCGILQQSDEGKRQCRMCHIMMSIAACTSGVGEQRCHAGLEILAVPVAQSTGESMAILSSCAFIRSAQEESWPEARMRGELLGADMRKLKQSLGDLPVLSPEDVENARAIMVVAGEAMKVIRRCALMEEVVQESVGTRGQESEVQDFLSKELKSALWRTPTRTRGQPPGQPQRRRQQTRDVTPLLIRTVEELVRRKPAMAFTVEQIAASARITPNHFSTVFHQHTGECFSDFLTSRRIELSKNLLRDLTLSVGEVAEMSGYDDPSYFSRRFRQKTGKSPREWREDLGRK